MAITVMRVIIEMMIIWWWVYCGADWWWEWKWLNYSDNVNQLNIICCCCLWAIMHCILWSYIFVMLFAAELGSNKDAFKDGRTRVLKELRITQCQTQISSHWVMMSTSWRQIKWSAENEWIHNNYTWLWLHHIAAYERHTTHIYWQLQPRCSARNHWRWRQWRAMWARTRRIVGDWMQ